ncbi:hypothetical protein T08_10037 [Trichinella sp. T8]|nr:hypothetical protein T08_5074 [Trichinella sp. T8]KRZ95003.1 hypothetical protein T08_10037 [Trichinella sp. T8]
MCMLSIIRRAKDPETRRMMVLNGTGLTIVLDTRQSSAVISDVIFNISHSVLRPSVYHQKLQLLTHLLQERENGKHITALD